MAPRSSWNGFLKIGELSIDVSLFAAATTTDRISFHTINRATGHRVHREFIDEETQKPVSADDQVKGYEIENGHYLTFEPDEIAAVIPVSDKTLEIETFLAYGDIDTLYFDRPYYLAPRSKDADEAFALLRDAMASLKVAALARAVLFRRTRSLLIRPTKTGFVAATLHFDYEVDPAPSALDKIADIKIDSEMLDLAQHIIDTKAKKFDIAAFDDRYEAALAELIKAKQQGRKLSPPKPRQETKSSDLLEALRASAGTKTPTASRKRNSVSPAPKATTRRAPRKAS